MLDPVTCAAMSMGAPRVAVSALIDLHLLIGRGFRPRRSHRRERLDDMEILLDQRRARQPEIRLDLQKFLEGGFSVQARAPRFDSEAGARSAPSLAPPH